jgi:heme/copper-type cytochrome/quinol oxidase subunit 1
MSKPAPASREASLEAALRAHLRYGSTALLLFLLGGLSLEFLHLIKAPWYLDQHLRRELWVLGHAHGALLALLNLAWAALLPRLPTAAGSGWALRWGAALVPAGFLLGGIGNSESDPSLAIIATPVGAALLIYALYALTRAAWQR